MSTPAPIPEPQARAINEAPFCWAEKAALRRIREALDDESYLDQALAVYLCHCELASDEQAPTYNVSRRKVALRSGVSIRRVQEIHNRLHKLKLLDWKQNRIEGSQEFGESTYTLLGLGTPCPTLGTPSPRLGRNGFSQSCTVVEESLEESLEESPEKGGRPPDGRGEKKKPIKVLTDSQRVSADKELVRVNERLKHIETYAIQDAWGVHYSAIESAERRKLNERKSALEKALQVAL